MSDSIVFGLIPYWVEYGDRAEVDPGNEGLVGHIDHRFQTIRILESLPPYQRRQTLWHEIVHQLCLERNLALDEDQIDALAYGLMGLVIQNPWLAEEPS